MARMCVDGKHALYRYCSERGIPHRNCGKLIVATNPKETEKLQSIKAHAEANGVLDMQLLTGDAARALEPALACDAALLSPSTGIIDSHAYMPRCAAKPRTRARPSRFTPADPCQGDRRRHRDRGGRRSADDAAMQPPRQRRRALGDHRGAQHRGHAAGTDPDGLPRQGNYFSCNARAPFSRLIYPVPEPGGLGGASDAGHGRAGPFRP